MLKIIEDNLYNFQKPGRYIGCESGIPEKDFKNSEVKFAISYPDVYEVGMSNNGIKIIYDLINKLNFASCERVFAPWSDFENFLLNNKIPLYSLESYTPIKEFDFIGFTLQYELLFTNILNILKLSDIECFREKRGDNTPIVIAGGPSSVNPAPFSPFIDLFFIGEIEDKMEIFLEKYKKLKEQRYSKDMIINELSKIEGFYSPKYSNYVKRQIFNNFTSDNGIDTFISPIIDIVQNKVVVEIMRGCPNKCRFCQAGIIYKPYREKNLTNIFNGIEKGIKNQGVTEVTLSSLSSGDYSRIIDLTEQFNRLYKNKNISFSLPSIKVESFNIELLEKISSVRKSGLTFAVESGSIDGQISLNKPVMLDKVKEIIQYASKNGWNLIKLYFMIGLPHISNEKEVIIDFIESILKIDRRLNLNINIATFVPKPHTPYERERQLTPDEAIAILQDISTHFKRTRARIKYHNPYTSYTEGIIARGDENVGLAVYEVFQNGGRLDGWEEKFNFELYKKAFEKYGITHEKYLEEKRDDEILYWDMVDVGITKDYLSNEKIKSINKVLSPSCKEACDPQCTICDKNIQKKDADKNDKVEIRDQNVPIERPKKITRYFLEFSKTGLLKFIGHIDTLKYFERLFFVSDVDLVFTEGFNPHAKLQFSSPLPLGIESQCEILEFFTNIEYTESELLEKIKFHENKNLSINKIRIIDSEKKISLINEIYSNVYSIGFDNEHKESMTEIFANFKNSGTYYTKEKKGIPISGNYNEYIDLLSIIDNNIIVEVKNTKDTPKLKEALIDILGNISLRILKKQILGLKDGVKLNLFDMVR